MSVELLREEERPAFVRFERRAVENKQKTVAAGRSISDDVDIVLVTPPGSKDVHENKVTSWLNNVRKNVRNGRTPQKWLEHWENAYESFKKGQEAPLNGTAIKDWSSISPAQIKNLISMNILTIEDLAAINDEGLNRIGMGGASMKKTAQNWLKAATDHGPLTLKVTQLESENAQLKSTVADLISKNTALMSQLENANQPLHAVEPVLTASGIEVADIIPDAFESGEVPVISDDMKIQPEDSARPNYKDSTHEELALAHKLEFGKDPHPSAKDETIRRKLTAIHP